MNWERITAEDGPDAGEYWMKGRIGPFEIDIIPPWATDTIQTECYLCISTGGDDAVEDTAASVNEAKRKALGWLSANFRDWQELIDNEMAKLRREERNDDH